MERDLVILDTPERNLPGSWEACVRSAMNAKVAVEDEIAKAVREHVSRPVLLSEYYFPDCLTPRVQSCRLIMLRGRMTTNHSSGNSSPAYITKGFSTRCSAEMMTVGKCQKIAK